MDIKVPSFTHRQQAKSAFAKQFAFITHEFLGFFQLNNYFFIPNDLVEAVATLLGYYLAGNFAIHSPEYAKNFTQLKIIAHANAKKGYKLAELFQRSTINLVSELKTGNHYDNEDAVISLQILDINLAVGKILFNNKQKSVTKIDMAIEVHINNFISSKLYPLLKINTADIPIIMGELGIYLGWLTGFYANLMESPLDVFSYYILKGITTAANHKNKH